MKNKKLRRYWLIEKLGDICDVQMGQSPPSSSYNSDEKGFPFFQGKSEFTNLYPVVRKWCDSPKKIAERNDILLSVRAPVGAVNIASEKCCIGRGLAAINYKRCYKFLFYYFQLIEQELDKKGTGTTFKAISGKVLKEVGIPLPPLPEQRAIVSKIEQLFSSLDDSTKTLKKALDQLKIYRQAVLKKAFEGELTKEWREKQKNLPTAEELLAEIKKERENHFNKQLDEWKIELKKWEDGGKEGKKPAKPKKLKELPPLTKDELPELPEVWIWNQMEGLSDFITKGTTPQKDKINNINANIPFIKVYNLTHNGQLDFTINPTFVDTNTHEEFLKRSIVYPGDILMNIVGPPLGKVSVVPSDYKEWNINQAIVRYRSYSTLNPKYLMRYLLTSSTINRLSKKAKATAGQFNLTLEICRDAEIPICSLSEQHQIVKEIESRLSVCDNTEQTIKDSLKKAESLRQSILKKAFNGELLTEKELEETRKAPDWEPAEKLLKRIKKEKEKK